mmetsp:Transcript_6450/g.14556  ORF Transcript_6450/g.14556 Transcript_6450/m.14556 type:complete len:89 (+) Transcript_6450:319-585(+)
MVCQLPRETQSQSNNAKFTLQLLRETACISVSVIAALYLYFSATLPQLYQRHHQHHQQTSPRIRSIHHRIVHSHVDSNNDSQRSQEPT